MASFDRSLLTEEEARTRWCPFVRGEAGRNRDGTEADGLRSQMHCITSACMAWRFRETGEFNSQANAEFRQTGNRRQSDTGYCGLAGHPSAES